MKKLFSTRYSDLSFDMSLFLLRAGFGFLLFFLHGLPKLTGFAERKDNFYDPFGIGSMPSLVLIIFAEVFCAIFLVMGLFTRLAAFVLVLAFLVIIFIRHQGDPVKEFEDAILYLLVFISILLLGPGRWSIDKLTGK